VHLGFYVFLGAYFGTGSGTGALSCRVTQSSIQSVAKLGFQQLIAVQLTVWPIWDDAIVVLASGLMRSTRLSRVINASATLLLFAPDSPSFLDNLTAVLNATRATWDGVSVQNPASFDSLAAARPFSVTLTGSNVIVLRASAAAFNTGMTVHLGVGVCVVGAVSNDGLWAVIVTPSAAAACEATNQLANDCGYITLVINTTSAAATHKSMHGVALSCPPFCGGALRLPTAVPMVDSSGDLVLGSFPPVGSGSPPLQRLGLSSVETSLGFYYATACSASGASTHIAYTWAHTFTTIHPYFSMCFNYR
jgi:hypothetical protein